MAVDACGLVGNGARLGMDGLGVSPDLLGPLKLTASVVGVTLNRVLKNTPQAHAKYQKKSAAEQALEAAAMGLSLYKFQMLLEELSRVYA